MPLTILFRQVTLIIALFAFCVFSTPAYVEEIPDSCKKAGSTTTDASLKQLLLQCVSELPEGGYRSLAYINLGTIAYLAGNFSEALQYYNLANKGVGTVASDTLFHAYRGSAYSMTGRNEDAVRDADTVVLWLQENVNEADEMRKELMEKIIPVFYAADETRKLDEVLDLYLPMKEKYWLDYLNKAAILSDIERNDNAYLYANEALKMEPENPATLNNFCYILTKTGKPEEALPYCEKALSLLPGRAEIWHSIAFVKAEMGDCAGSETSRLQAVKLQPKVEEYKIPLRCMSK